VRIAGIVIGSFVFFTLGCGSVRRAVSPPEQPASFAPVAMRIHPIFSRVKDWSGDNYPDGIEALIEFQDQLGDATKASGRVIFELYSFQKFDSERKGNRLANPWIGSLETTEDQRLRWNRTSRTYSFPLAFDQVSPGGTYLLTAQFQLSNGGRFYDQIVLEPPQGAYSSRGTSTSAEPINPTTGPSSAPATESTSQP
jgi:hypothetical protein